MCGTRAWQQLPAETAALAIGAVDDRNLHILFSMFGRRNKIFSGYRVNFQRQLRGPASEVADPQRNQDFPRSCGARTRFLRWSLRHGWCFGHCSVGSRNRNITACRREDDAEVALLQGADAIAIEAARSNSKFSAASRICVSSCAIGLAEFCFTGDFADDRLVGRNAEDDRLR